MTNTRMELPRWAASRFRLRRIWWCVTVVLLAGTSIARADHPITVTGMNNLAFGLMFRNNTASVSCNSGNAAQFTVTGKKKRLVTLIVSITSMTTGNGASSNMVRRAMSPAITTQSCQYSIDGGATWTSFTSANGEMAMATAEFPHGSGPDGTILVRVGASVTSSLAQQRGGYSGSVVLTAQYGSEEDYASDDDDGNNGHGNDSDHDDDSNPGNGG